MASSLSIQAVAERTGLSPHVIRAWERRYRAIEPERTPGKHRLYSEAEVARLILLSRAVADGHSIGKIATLSTDELRALAAASPARTESAGAGSSPFREDLLTAVEIYDEALLNVVLHRGLLSQGTQGLIMRTVAPLAQEIGERWRSGELTAAQEHFFTAGVKMFLGGLTKQFSAAPHAPCLVVGTPSGQLHELGALMVTTVAANLGWRSLYLGPSLPAHEIAGAAQRNGAVAVALSIVYPEDDPNLAGELTELARLLAPGTRLLVGGRAASAYRSTLVRIGARQAGTLEEFNGLLDAVRRG